MNELTKQVTILLVAVVTTVVTIIGGIIVVNHELSKEAATHAYSSYLEALILRSSEETGLVHEEHKRRSLTAANFLLYANEDTIEKVLLLRKVFDCNYRLMPGYQQISNVILSMRRDVGRRGNFNFDKYNSVFCVVWPKP